MNTLAKIYKIRLKVDDKVVILSGKDKGKTGKVLKVHPKLNKVTVEGINIIKKHVKPTRENKIGSIKEITKPIWVSKVGIFEPTSKKPSRISYAISVDNVKTRVFQKTKKEIVK